MESTENSKPEPVTALIVRQVKPGLLSEFEGWVRGMTPIVQQFDGYLGTDLIRPRDLAHPEVVIVVRFDSYENLKVFMESAERDAWLKESDKLTIGQMDVSEQQGLVSWFNLPNRISPTNPPAKSKMAIITILILYPSLLLVSTLLKALLHDWPRPVVIFITLLVLIPAMTYFLMPWATRFFRRWLYPDVAGK